MKTYRMRLFVVVVAVVALAALQARADYIAGVTVDSRSSEIGTRLATYTIDSDSSFDPDAGTLDEGERGWMTQGTDYSPQITYDLGDSYDLASIHIWNWNQAGFVEQGFSSVRIETAGTDKSFSVLLATYALSKAPGEDDYTGQTITASVSDVQYVHIRGLSTWYATDGFYDRGGENWKNEAGLGKVMFTAVPEPSTAALLAACLVGLLAYAWRKRK